MASCSVEHDEEFIGELKNTSETEAQKRSTTAKYHSLTKLAHFFSGLRKGSGKEEGKR